MNPQLLRKFASDARISLIQLIGVRIEGFDAKDCPEENKGQLVEHYAAFWFISLISLRYLEVHGFLDWSPFLERDRKSFLKKCTELHAACPIVLDGLDDTAIKLFPAKLGNLFEVEEGLFKDGVEILGWLYQFYLADLKSEVIGKTIEAKDIPVATQLFTPKWIAGYLVENALGKSYFKHFPDSPLRDRLKYFVVDPTSREGSKRIDEHFLEELTVIDPACGTGNVLLEAYDLLKSFYLEQGYGSNQIPKLIFKQNLFGLDLDGHAVRLARFSLLAKGLKDDGELLLSDNLDLRKNICEIVEPGVSQEGDLAQCFKNAHLFGSLINIPRELAPFVSDNNPKDRSPLLLQARLLAKRYQCVITNPPYLATRYMIDELRRFARKNYPDSWGDLASMFLERCFAFTKEDGYVAMLTMHGWMFLPTFQPIRERIIKEKKILSLLHLGTNAFRSFSGEVVQAAAFVIQNAMGGENKPKFFRLLDGDELSKKETFLNGVEIFSGVSQSELLDLPGAKMAYWASPRMRGIFSEGVRLDLLANPRQGLATGDNQRFVRRWYEVNPGSIDFDCKSHFEARASKKRWLPYNKGGTYRKWYGNHDFVISYDDESFEALADSGNKLPSRDYYCKPGVTWTLLTSHKINVRIIENGFLFDVNGMMVFENPSSGLNRYTLLGFMASKVCFELLRVINPTLAFQAGNVKALPILEPVFLEEKEKIEDLVKEAIAISKEDWDSKETSWNFSSHPFLSRENIRNSLQEAFEAYQESCQQKRESLKEIEETINRIFIEAYGLSDELGPEISDNDLCLEVADRKEAGKSFISYCVGCLLGRLAGPVTDSRPLTRIPGAVVISIQPGKESEACLGIKSLLESYWSKGTLESNLRFLAESISGRVNCVPEIEINKYLLSSFYSDHIKRYRKRPVYWLLSSGPKKVFQCLVLVHTFSADTLSHIRERVVSIIEENTPENEELLTFERNLRACLERFSEFNLDDGIKVNYQRFSEILAYPEKVN